MDLIEPAGTTKFAYNAAGLVARIRWRDASATYFFYDGRLNRFAMVSGGIPTYFLWQGHSILQELNADGTVKEEHTNMRSPIAGIGQLVETNRPGEAVQKIYPVMDPRGTISRWSKSDGTSVLASREYEAFGTLIPGAASGAWPGRFGYQGQAWIEIGSADTGQRLLLSPTRVYDPLIGRFLQTEVLVTRRPAYNYIYVSQSPTVSTDALGLQDDEKLGEVIRLTDLELFIHEALDEEAQKQAKDIPKTIKDLLAAHENEDESTTDEAKDKFVDFCKDVGSNAGKRYYKANKDFLIGTAVDLFGWAIPGSRRRRKTREKYEGLSILDATWPWQKDFFANPKHTLYQPGMSPQDIVAVQEASVSFDPGIGLSDLKNGLPLLAQYLTKGEQSSHSFFSQNADDVMKALDIKPSVEWKDASGKSVKIWLDTWNASPTGSGEVPLPGSSVEKLWLDQSLLGDYQSEGRGVAVVIDLKF